MTLHVVSESRANCYIDEPDVQNELLTIAI